MNYIYNGENITTNYYKILNTDHLYKKFVNIFFQKLK